ncbi:hypothetical protein J6590_002212 [Homalodisca vitripennis]|nr:hypothetical protein J6590_002212 [Homalodisca vitripennis]
MQGGTTTSFLQSLASVIQFTVHSHFLYPSAPIGSGTALIAVTCFNNKPFDLPVTKSSVTATAICIVDVSAAVSGTVHHVIGHVTDTRTNTIAADRAGSDSAGTVEGGEYGT